MAGGRGSWPERDDVRAIVQLDEFPFSCGDAFGSEGGGALVTGWLVSTDPHLNVGVGIDEGLLHVPRAGRGLEDLPARDDLANARGVGIPAADPAPVHGVAPAVLVQQGLVGKFGAGPRTGGVSAVADGSKA